MNKKTPKSFRTFNVETSPSQTCIVYGPYIFEQHTVLFVLFLFNPNSFQFFV